MVLAEHQLKPSAIHVPKLIISSSVLVLSVFPKATKSE